MSEKYITVWIWLINGIIAAATVWFANSLVLNPDTSWTLKVNQIPAIMQTGLDTKLDLRKSDGEILRTVSDPLWRITGKFNLNQLVSPPEPPEPPEGNDEDDEPVLDPPTRADALADLKNRIKINGLFAPMFAYAQINSTGMEVVLIPYERINPSVVDDIQKTDENNVYDDMTEIGLQARCTGITPEGVYFEYTFSRGEHTETFRDLLIKFEIEIIDSPVVDNPENGSTAGNPRNGHTNRNPKNNGYNNLPDTTVYNEKTNTVVIGRKDYERMSTNFAEEISSYGATIVKNRKTGETEGLQLSRVPENSVAKKVGFTKGDVIISVNSHKVKSTSDAISWAKSNPDESVYVVKYMRNGQTMTRTISNPNK